MMKTKRSYVHSAIALLLCISMFIGTTFAWFTDQVTSGKNIITSGNLDLEMYWTDNLNSGTWYNVEEDAHNTIFNYDNWEPGYTDVKYIKLVNAGKLALNYKLTLDPQNSVGKLAEVINVYFAEGGVAVEQRSDLQKLRAIGLLNNVLNGGATADGTLLPADQYSPLHPSGEVIMTVAMSMITSAGNEYQSEDAGEFSITALATQAPFEWDSFGNDYDANAEFSTILKGDSATAPVSPVNGKVPAGGVTLIGEGVSAFVPEGVALKAGTDKLTLTVTPLEKTTSDITVVNNEVLIPVDVHIDGIAEDNTAPIIIDLGEVLPKYLNMGNYRLFHVEDGVNNAMTLVADKAALAAHNQFTYDPLTGAVSVAMASFSEVVGVADTTAKWEGGEDYSWYVDKTSPYMIANADQLYAFAKIVGGMANGIERDSFAGKTVKLLSDIDLNYGTVLNTDGAGAEKENKEKKIFYPVGYWNNDEVANYDDKTGKAISSGFYSFEGTFDGQGHTVSNIYQNTWEMKGDHNWYDAKDQHYRDGMGLFGKVYSGTIKNLTVHNFESDGEITTTGVIASYADGATFENIAITNCNPRVYNIGNGGIVGCVGWYAKDAGLKTTFKNITVDKTNKISALWGSYDVACGGIVGQYYPTSGQTSVGSPKNAGIHFENCNMAAQMDVYNDVCGNYQYYAYRYAGMMIGSIRENLPADENGHIYPDMTGISATNCTVNYGDWNDYYYCEFVENGHPSYSGPNDYKFSRVPNSEIDTSNGKENATCIGHNHSDVENNQAIYLPFHQLFTGYGWGVTSKGLEDFDGITIQIRESEQNESVVKFETKFTGNFLYRVGNQNKFEIGNLFEAKEGATINSSGVWVTVEKLDEEMNITAKFEPSTDTSENGWTKGTLDFDGTGVAKITIQDYDYCTPTSIYVEVVDATNVATYSDLSKGGSAVFLKDITMSNGGSLYRTGGVTLYGNGFKFDVSKGAYSGVEYDYQSYVIYLENSRIDNMQIIGAVYPKLGGSRTNDYNRAIVMTNGDSVISNSYISNGASPIRNGGNLELINTTLKGGIYSNIDLRNGHLILDNVTTINQIGINEKYGETEIVGMGVVVYQEGGSEQLKITIRNNLKQYNYLSKSQADKYLTNEYAKQIKNVVYGSDFESYKNGEWINFGIISMNNYFDKDDLVDKRADKAGYYGTAKTITIASISRDCYCYSFKPASTTPPTYAGYETVGQGAIKPEVKFDFTEKNYVKPVEDSNDYCYADGRTVYISMDEGDSFSWDTAILSVEKYGKSLESTVKVDGVDQTGKSVTFDKSGTHTVEYVYTDKYNYTLKDGSPAKFDVTYTETITLEVSAVKAAAKNAEFSFGKDGTYYQGKTVLIGDKTYVMPDVNATESGKIGSKSVNGTTVYYPIVEMVTSDGKTAHTGSWYACFPIFKDALQIIDYADKGTGDAVEYSQDTVTKVDQIPATLKATDPANTFLYSMNKTNYPAPTEPFAKDNVVYYTCNRNGLDGGSNYPRKEETIVAEYTYTDNALKTYTFYIGYHCAEQTKGTISPCVTGDTLVTLADGSTKRIDEVNYNDKLLVWNFYEGKYDVAPVAIIFDHGADDNTVIKLTFSDGTKVNVVNMHQFFDSSLNKLVTINADTVSDFVGHKFAKRNGIENDFVELVGYNITREYVEAWGIMTAGHYNIITEGMLSADFDLKDVELFNYFEVGEGMKYDEAKMQTDIEKYGLYTYEDFAEYLTPEQFAAFNVQYFKIAVGKGNYTYQGILELIDQYLN